jgi:hypothetical protein
MSEFHTNKKRKFAVVRYQIHFSAPGGILAAEFSSSEAPLVSAILWLVYLTPTMEHTKRKLL